MKARQSFVGGVATCFPIVGIIKMPKEIIGEDSVICVRRS